MNGFCVIPDCDVPSDQVMLHGAVPVNVAVIPAVCPDPAVIVPPPLTLTEALHDGNPSNLIIPGRLIPLASGLYVSVICAAVACVTVSTEPSGLYVMLGAWLGTPTRKTL